MPRKVARQHLPHICANTQGFTCPRRKNSIFFDDETQAWPKPDLTALHRHFQTAEADQLWGEATPISLYWDPAAERIWRYNSAMRMIVILRNPIDRAYSHWAMEHRRGEDPAALRPCARTEKKLDAAKPCRSSIDFSPTSTAAFTAPS